MVGADLLSFWSARTSLSLLGSHETGGETTEAGSQCGRSSLSAPHIAPLCAIGRTIAHHYALLCATACYRPCLLRKCEMGYAAFANMLRLQNGQPSCPTMFANETELFADVRCMQTWEAVEKHVCRQQRLVCRSDSCICKRYTCTACLQTRCAHSNKRVQLVCK